MRHRRHAGSGTVGSGLDVASSIRRTGRPAQLVGAVLMAAGIVHQMKSVRSRPPAVMHRDGGSGIRPRGGERECVEPALIVLVPGITTTLGASRGVSPAGTRCYTSQKCRAQKERQAWQQERSRPFATTRASAS